jgi:hypothetical protein
MSGSWSPRWRHVTQIHSDGSGWSDCAEAAVARALMEYDPTTPARMANPEWALVREVADPKSPITIWDLISRICIIARGYPDSPNNPPTSNVQFERVFTFFGLTWTTYTTFISTQDEIFSQVWNNHLTLCWVDGTTLQPASYPASYFNGWSGYDHIILGLPNGQFNDPLTVFSNITGRAASIDVYYSATSVREALGGCWVLPPPEGTQTIEWIVSVDAKLKLWPNHLGAPVNRAVASISEGEQVFPTGYSTPSWVEVKNGKGIRGFLLKSNIARKLVPKET